MKLKKNDKKHDEKVLPVNRPTPKSFGPKIQYTEKEKIERAKEKQQMKRKLLLRTRKK